MRKTITIKESIIIDSNKIKVWEFTQNFKKRKLWDKTILDCKVLQKRPEKLIWLKMKGGIQTNLKYKLCNKPNKTSLKMYDTKSLFLKGGGGSWQYLDFMGKTKWIQTNSVEMNNNIIFYLLGWLIRREFKKHTKMGMKRAKFLIENENCS